jgi:hypothetical protein
MQQLLSIIICYYEYWILYLSVYDCVRHVVIYYA